MPNKNELTTTQALDALHEFGNKQFLRGYQRANLEWLIAIGGLGLIWGVTKFVDWRDKKKASKIITISEEEAE